MAFNTYVLVHGAWHGGWSWRRVAQGLRAGGHEVFTPTLTGCGERSHLLAPQNDLELNIEDVLAVIRHEELDDIILCGHSYAGMIITAVADRMPTAVRALVYVEAYVPRDGECVLDLRSSRDNDTLLDRVRSHGDGWRMPPRSAEDLRVQQPRHRNWVNNHLTATALRCFTQPLALGDNMPGNSSKVYVRAGDFPNKRFQAYYEAAGAAADWSHHLVDHAGHDVMVDQPQQLTEILQSIG